MENGLVERATYANGSGVSYGYDDANRVNAVKHLGANGAIVQEYGYGFDKNGNRLNETITRNGQTRRLGTFTYDEVNRLKSVTFGPKTTEYDYDEVGNRLVERDWPASRKRIKVKCGFTGWLFRLLKKMVPEWIAFASSFRGCPSRPEKLSRKNRNFVLVERLTDSQADFQNTF